MQGSIVALARNLNLATCCPYFVFSFFVRSKIAVPPTSFIPLNSRGGAKLNPGSSSEEYIFNANSSIGLKYLSQHLSDDANILFTGCNMTMDCLTNPETQVRIDSYTDVFLSDNRKMLFNGVTLGSNIPLIDKNKNIVGETFLFDTDLVKKNGKNYSAFMQFNLNSKGKSVFSNRLYNIKVRSNGGFLRTDFMENKKIINNGTKVIKK